MDFPTANQRARRPDPAVVLGVKPAPIDSDQWADCCMLYWLMPPEKQREFWTLQGDKADKLGFLLRWGHFEQWRKPQ